MVMALLDQVKTVILSNVISNHFVQGTPHITLRIYRIGKSRHGNGTRDCRIIVQMEVKLFVAKQLVLDLS